VTIGAFLLLWLISFLRKQQALAKQQAKLEEQLYLKLLRKLDY
jgi:hypothetical protein